MEVKVHEVKPALEVSVTAPPLRRYAEMNEERQGRMRQQAAAG